MSRTEWDLRWNTIHLNFEGKQFDKNNWDTTDIMFQKAWKTEPWEENTYEIPDSTGRPWSIVHADDFSRNQVSIAMTNAVRDVEELLEGVKFTNHPNIATDIIKTLVVFWDDALHILSRLEKEK